MGRETGISWTDSTWNPIRGCSRVSEGCRNCYAEKVAYRFSGERLDGKASPFEGLVRRAPNGMRLPQWNGKIKFVEEHLLDPLKWKPTKKKCIYCDMQGHPCDGSHSCTGATYVGKRIFVNSMSDLFHENVTDDMLDRIFAVMALCPQHTFQILTKRPEQMLAYLTKRTDKESYRLEGSLLERQFASHDRVFSAMVEMLKEAPADALNRASDWNEIHFPNGDGFMRAWPLPNVRIGVSVENQKAADGRLDYLC